MLLTHETHMGYKSNWTNTNNPNTPPVAQLGSKMPVREIFWRRFTTLFFQILFPRDSFWPLSGEINPYERCSVMFSIC